MISIITPVLDHPEFIAAYAAAMYTYALEGTHKVEVLIVDTGSTAENRAAWANVGTIVDYPIKGHNYGHWCNAGYAKATGDIIVFLNNDVRATGDWLGEVAASVEPGAIYGPELLAQIVGGIRIPFLSGWCIAATRETWERLMTYPVKHELAVPGLLFPAGNPYGPWNTIDYPAAGYWEDNDLCFRAVMAGIELKQTKWPIEHLDGGNGTSKHKREYYKDVATNRATFAKSVQEAMRHATV